MCKTLSSLNQRLKAEALDQPVLVIERAKVLKSLNQFLDRGVPTRLDQRGHLNRMLRLALPS